MQRSDRRKEDGEHGERGLARVRESGNFSVGEGEQAVRRSYSGLSSFPKLLLRSLSLLLTSAEPSHSGSRMLARAER